MPSIATGLADSPHPADPALRHGGAFAAGFAALRQTHDHIRVRPHRSMTPMQVTPFLVAQAILLPVLLCALLVWGRNEVFDLWRETVLFWSRGMGMPFQLAEIPGRMGSYGSALTIGVIDRPLPSWTDIGVSALVVLALLWLSMQMRKESLPLKYPLRIVCMVQASALVYFCFVPEQFPYTISRHSEELMFIGYVMLLATPVMLAAGYYILNASLLSKLANSVAILAFLALLIPHQVMAQAYLMHHLSVLYMPVLYICFGAVFDALVFVALYSWAASDLSPQATL
ncbi:MAG: hypothetical protein EOO32_02200 [Comamonadaceae bacterium]|nr:MAG: hypothetical protein EOO32_02200 [Comamonadaceae bacterium]